MTDYLGLLREFHETYGHLIATHPSQPSDEVKVLRIALMAEELTEVLAAMDEGDLPNIAKELADLLYVVFGTALGYGIPMDEVFAEVHRSNMSKVGEDGKPIFRDDGKVLKGPNFQPADIAPILKRRHLT